MLYVANIDEAQLGKDDGTRTCRRCGSSPRRKAREVVVLAAAHRGGDPAARPRRSAPSFLESVGPRPSRACNKVVRAGYKLLGLQTYFTVGEQECRAWTIHKGAKAPQAAGVIHTDFERGFIKAEVMRWEDLLKLGSEAAVQEKGLLRIEGKEYVVQDGDCMHFRLTYRVISRGVTAVLQSNALRSGARRLHEGATRVSPLDPPRVRALSAR